MSDTKSKHPGDISGVSSKQGAAEKSLPQTVPGERRGQMDFLETVVQSLSLAYESFPPYWSRVRDSRLRNLYRTNDWIGSAVWNITTMLGSIDFRVVPRNRAVQSHQDLAERYQKIWEITFSRVKDRFITDILTQDNGGFLEILDAPGDDADPSLPRTTFGGFRYLDAGSCQRTGDPDYPVLVKHTDGKLYKLHFTRVLELAQLPSGEAVLKGVGLCALSRCLHNASLLGNISTLYEEMFGDRPLSQIVVGKKISSEQLEQIFAKADQKMDNDGLKVYSRMVFVGIPSHEGDLKTLPLKHLPEGFDKVDEVELAVHLIAMAFGVDARELFPATMSGATKADAQVQHRKTRGKTPAWYMRRMKELAEALVLPASLMLEYDAPADEEADQMKAEIYKTAAETISSELGIGITDERAARLYLVDLGRLSQEEFERLELLSGRLPDGMSVTSLFYSNEPIYIELLSIAGFSDPLDFENNQPEMIIPVIDTQMREVMKLMTVNKRAVVQEATRQSYAALRELRDQYLAMMQAEEQQPGDEMEGEQPQDEETRNDEPPDQGDQGDDDKSKRRKRANRVYRQIEERKEALRRLDSPLSLPRNRLISRKSAGAYEADVRAAITLFWEYDVNRSGFIGLMEDNITDWFTDAFLTAADQAGLTEDDLSITEWEWLETQVLTEAGYVPGLADYVQSLRDNGGNLETALSRAPLWGNGWNRIRSRALTIFESDPKLMWILGKTEKHCKSCSSVAYRVYRASTWEKWGWFPQSRDLECGGWRCDCRFEITDERLTPGRPPAIKSVVHYHEHDEKPKSCDHKHSDPVVFDNIMSLLIQANSHKSEMII